MATPIGLTFPLARTNTSLGAIAFSTTEMEATLNNMKSLVLTNWGERPGNFDLGCNLIEFIFSNLDETTIFTIKSRIEEQVTRWLPYVTISDLTVEPAEKDGHIINIIIKFFINGRQDMSTVLELAVDLTGA